MLLIKKKKLIIQNYFNSISINLTFKINRYRYLKTFNLCLFLIAVIYDFLGFF